MSCDIYLHAAVISCDSLRHGEACSIVDDSGQCGCDTGQDNEGLAVHSRVSGRFVSCSGRFVSGEYDFCSDNLLCYRTNTAGIR